MDYRQVSSCHWHGNLYASVLCKQDIDVTVVDADLLVIFAGKAPIKVLARKKFKVTSGGISAGILSHLVERNKCMKVFAEAFGLVPLRTTEFRADPVLYKVDAVPEILKLYPSNGGL